jgi:hypothetical protein
MLVPMFSGVNHTTCNVNVDMSVGSCVDPTRSNEALAQRTACAEDRALFPTRQEKGPCGSPLGIIGR